ncbi:hypothetical protein G5T41_00230 [Acinetobacter sp. GFQ9D192M]|uniref:hypothetical protein n=1 Tax=unclassified Acinetobacter TaxID=196816 RepID=UPI0014080D52|nr:MULTISPECIES: hypothetical protein [unclassified Acinetobacter]NHB65510.1 hypothetical protein [Acinetobacter sp. GFQ9D191M]NHB98985.1 hypothetical protein [Acinetobacter sp. GFQ9D192M]
MQASSSGNYIAEEAFKNSFVQQSPSLLKNYCLALITIKNGGGVLKSMLTLNEAIIDVKES